MSDVALLIDWENVYYTLRQHTTGPLPSSLAILQAILQKSAEFGPVRVKLAIFGQEVASQDETLLMALEFTGIEPIAVAQRMSGRILKGRSDAVLITRALKLLYKERPELETWFIVSGDRDLNALCKALKDEDKRVYLVAGDKSLANELRDSPYLRDDVFLLEDLIPQARWTRTGMLRTDDSQADKADKVDRPERIAVPAPERPALPPPERRPRGGRGRGGARVRQAPIVPAVVPTASPESEKEQRRLVVLLLDQLVALRAEEMPRGDFVTSVVPLSEKEASTVLEQRIDAAIEQQHVTAQQAARTRMRSKLLLRPNMSSPLVAETIFHLVRVLRRVDSVTAKDARRIPVVEAVLDPLSRADQPGGLARGRTQRRMLLEMLFNIAEERGAVATEQVTREGRQVAMCWLVETHPLVEYARQRAASIVHLFNFVASTKGEDAEWVNAALFSELLSRVEGDGLEAMMRDAVERGLMRAEDHGKKAGYVLRIDDPEAMALLGRFALLADKGAATEAARSVSPEIAALPAPVNGTPLELPEKTTRRGSRGGRGRRGGRGKRKTAAPSGTDAQSAGLPGSSETMR